MHRTELINEIRKKGSYLCIGLDPDITRIPVHLLREADPVFTFNKEIIEATGDLCVAYKMNMAFYESMGVKGWQTLERTLEIIPTNIFTIADAKRGDIGNSASQYAKTFFETFNFDAVTVSPYMGKDSVMPFLEHKDKWTILLALTSNEGAKDFELQKVGDEYLYEIVLKASGQWGTPDNLMYVLGATQPEWFTRVRSICPHHFYLVPGVGAQGGSLEKVSRLGMNEDIGLLVNVGRAIIYASQNPDFAGQARDSALDYQKEMLTYIR